MTNLLDAARDNSMLSLHAPSTYLVLIVLDDDPMRQRLASALDSLGFKVITTESVSEGFAQIELSPPTHAVVDLRRDDGCGLDIISALKQKRPDARAIVVSRYGNIANAVRAAKLGAVDYLVTGDADDVISTLLAPKGCKVQPPEHPKSANRVRWEQIQYAYESCGRNVSEAARLLGMHRRSLQRVLSKGPVRDAVQSGDAGLSGQ